MPECDKVQNRDCYDSAINARSIPVLYLVQASESSVVARVGVKHDRLAIGVYA